MPKIKDLGDVLLDNALLLFPVDSERYELGAAVKLLAAYDMQYLGLYEHEDWRVNDWICSTDTLVRRSVDCFLRSLTKGYTLSNLDWDRVRRLQALVPNPLGTLDDSDLGDGIIVGEFVYRNVWREISQRMSLSSTFSNGHPTTGRIPT